MCGIAGIYSARPLERIERAHLGGMMDVLHHRGPDGNDVHFEPDSGIAMGHTRLSIVDLTMGQQPIISGDGRFVLTVNGELYDFKKHRALALAEGDRFNCKSDSEIAIALFRKHGLDFFPHLRGEFAMSLYDGEEDELYLVRDRFGIRPLFYYCDGEKLIYGSEAKAVLAHPAVPRRLNRRAALHQLMQVMKPGESAFEDVHILRPGHFLRVRKRNGRLEVDDRRYWDFAFPTEEEREDNISSDSYIEGVRQQLVDSIVVRLEADVPVGCYLSGGIDSCCILGLAQGALQNPIKTFTISFDHDSYDEASIAREMADSVSAEHVLIPVKAEELYGENYLAGIWHSERTFYNTFGIAKMMLSKRVRELGYKTVITGEGADELFAGYPAMKRDMFLHGLEAESPEVRAEYQRQLEESNRIFKGAILSENEVTHPALEEFCGFTPSWIQPWLLTLPLVKPLLSADALEEIGDYDPIEGIVSTLDRQLVDGRHPLDKSQYTWTKTQFESQVLGWGGDRMDMAYSMETRPAMLDHHFVENALQVPPRLRVNGTVEKWILREATRGILPDVLYKRQKFAFMAPPAHTDKAKQARADDLVGEFLNRDAIREAGILDEEKVTAFLSEYGADGDATKLVRKDAVLNHLLGLQALDRLFIQSPRAATRSQSILASAAV